jgi:hypothetical protein
MSNNEDIITDDLTKNEDGQYVNKAGEIVAVESIAYRNERLEERKREDIDAQLGKDKSTSVEDPDTKRDNAGRQNDPASKARKAAAKKATEKSAKAIEPKKATPMSEDQNKPGAADPVQKSSSTD